MELHRGRLIDHLHIVVADAAALQRARRFYEAVLGALGRAITHAGDDFFAADELFVSTAGSKAAAGKTTGRIHLGLQAEDRAAVDRFHAAGLAAGGRDNGGPAERPYHPGYYAAFLTDPAGNNVEAVFHGPAEYSARSVVIRF